jgi:hypothetical protein
MITLELGARSSQFTADGRPLTPVLPTAIAQGRPASSDPALADPETVAALVILREVMHHLGFTQLRFGPA